MSWGWAGASACCRPPPGVQWGLQQCLLRSVTLCSLHLAPCTHWLTLPLASVLPKLPLRKACYLCGCRPEPPLLLHRTGHF